QTFSLASPSYGSGDKSLRLPLSSVWGGVFADVGGIGIGIVIVQIWFGNPVDSDDGSALDPSFYGGGSDRRGD
ncbi:hypothetical protein PSY31_23300, partial [Shigella flexneri]|nr:hypothetical protein [Shigella flexneri]